MPSKRFSAILAESSSVIAYPEHASPCGIARIENLHDGAVLVHHRCSDIFLFLSRSICWRSWRNTH